jgi:lipid A 3-O-deacylase
LLLLAVGAAPARATEPTAVAAFGLVGPERGENRSAVLDLEYRFRAWRWGIGPVVGASVTSDGGGYVRAGLGRDFPFKELWNLNISSGGGYYEPGHGKRLGRGFEFRTAFDLSYQIQPGVRFGGAVAHLSNAGIGRNNPGIETVTLTLAFTPSRMTKR